MWIAVQIPADVCQNTVQIDVTEQEQAVPLNMYQQPWVASGHAKCYQVAKQKLRCAMSQLRDVIRHKWPEDILTLLL